MSKRRRSRTLGVKWLVLALVAGAAIYYGSARFKSKSKVVYPPTAFYQVKRADMLISVVEDGALRALNETTIRSSLEGLNRIIQLVPEGAHVKKGELLVELDSAGLRDRLNEQELAYQERLFQLQQAEGNLQIQKSLGESQIKDGELKVENAESDLEKYRDGDAPLLIKTIEARAGVLNEQVRIATERFKRTEDLFKANNATRSEYEADQLSLKREQLALGQYQEDLRLILKFDQPNQVRLLEAKVRQAKEDLERLKLRASNEVAQVEADMKTSRRNVELLEESVQIQKRRLTNAKIFAPQDGLVVYAAVSPFQNMGSTTDQRGGGGGEGRGRGSGGGGGRGGGGGGSGDGEFRGGARRGGRGSDSSGGSASVSSASSGTAQTAASGSQRNASATAGSGAVQSSGGGSGGAGGSAGSGGARSGGGSSSGGGGQNTASASSAFVSYPSMRPSSSIPVANGNASAAAGTGGGGSGSGASATGGGQSSPQLTSQFGFRSSSQNNNFGGSEMQGTPGVLEEGLMVRQRQELIRLPDVSKMIAEIKIHESRVRQVKPGMVAYVRVDNIPDRRFKGTIRRVAPLPDAQTSWLQPELKVFLTDILIDDELPDLKPGVSARAEVLITNLTGVLSVPIQTVALLWDETVCYVKRGEAVTPVPVTTGWFNDRFVEIKSGLKDGDQVLLAPISDEDMGGLDTPDTNEVEAVTAPAAEEAPAEERTVRRGNRNAGESADGAVSEGGGERPRRRRPQTTQEAPE